MSCHLVTLGRRLYLNLPRYGNVSSDALQAALEIAGSIRMHHSIRNWSDSAMWSAPIVVAPARSAIVRATLRTRS